MENVILQQNSHWKESYQNLIDREILASLIQKLQLKEIQVLLGIRRSGKSSLFQLLINHLMKEADPKSIMYVNLDDPFYTEIYTDARKLYQVVETAEKMTGKKILYLFLDEVQNVRDWEKYVKSVYDSSIYRKIFLTGSNSSLLKGQYAQLLSGRYVRDEVYPFSFREILKENKIDNRLQQLEQKPQILSLIDTMMEYGSYPEIYKTEDPDLKRELLINYYDTIVLKDCIANARIREVRLFKEVAHYVLTNAGTLFSYNSIARALNANENTIKEFLNVLENGFLINELRVFSYSLKQQTRSRKKTYAMDNGILANISFRFSANRGKLFENLIFSELKKNGFEIFFYHNKSECDFIVRKGEEIKAIQSCYDLTSQNRAREIEGLRNAMKQFSIPEGTIITYNQQEDLGEVHAIPFWDFFS
jgi:predicted AAA+ superfamily ATPase